MKYFTLLLCTTITTISFTMEKLELRNRDLNTLEKPHIIIINQLPTDNPHITSTRIDISDQTKVKNYTKESYRSDDSTKTIYPHQGIRFSPHTHKTIHEYKRLGMNDKGDAALIALYIHGALLNSYMHLIIGKGAEVQFGDIITFTTDDDNDIVLKHNNTELTLCKTQKDHPHRIKQFRHLEKDFFFQPHPLIGISNIAFEGENINWMVYYEFLEKNPYIKGIVTEALTSQ